jgi:hypothetical protein
VQFNQTLTDGLQQGVYRSLQAWGQGWMEQHPLGFWLLSHPLWAIALCLTVLFITWGLLSAFVQLTQNLWIFLLQAPFKLLKATFSGLLLLVRVVKPGGFLKRKSAVPSPFVATEAIESQSKAELQPQTQQQRLSEILHRLEQLRQEQDALMQEAQTILLTCGCDEVQKANDP